MPILLLLLLGTVAIAAVAASGSPSAGGGAVRGPAAAGGGSFGTKPTKCVPKFGELNGYPKGPPTKVGIPITPYAPSGYQWVALKQPIVTDPSNGNVFQVWGLDAMGQWWAVGFPGGPDGIKITPTEPGSSFQDKIWDFTEHVVVPVIGGVIAAAAPGVGTVFAKALLAWSQLAQGASLGSATLAATRTQVAPNPLALSAFDQGVSAVKNGLTEDAVKSAEKSLLGFASSDTIHKAFETAIQLTRSHQVQTLSLGSLACDLSSDQLNVARDALSAGGSLDAIMAAFGGKAGTDLLQSTTSQASKFVADNSTKPDVLGSAIANAESSIGGSLP